MASVKGFTVTLERDIKEEDFQRILEAVEMTKGVLHVEPEFVTHDDHINRTRMKWELTQKILELINKD